MVVIEEEIIHTLKNIHPLFKPLMEMAADSYEGENDEKYYLEFDDGVHHSLGVANIHAEHNLYSMFERTKFTDVTLELFNMRTGRVTKVLVPCVYQFGLVLGRGASSSDVSKKVFINKKSNIEVSYRNLTQDDINFSESKHKSNHHVYFYKKEESSEDEEHETNEHLEFFKHMFLMPFRLSIFAIFMLIISSTFGSVISNLASPTVLGNGVMITALNLLVIPLTLYMSYKLTKMSNPIANKLYNCFVIFIEKLSDGILKLGANVFSHFESTKDFSSDIRNELEYGVSARSIYMIDSDIAINQPSIQEEMNTIILLNNEPTTPYRLHEFLDMAKTSKTGKYNKLIFNFGDKGHVIKRITPNDVDALSDTDYETKAIVDSCIAEPLTPQEVKHIILTIENVKKVKKEEKEQAKSQHYYNKYKPQAQSRESEPSVFEQTLSELEKDIRDDMEKHKDVIEKHKS